MLTKFMKAELAALVFVLLNAVDTLYTAKLLASGGTEVMPIASAIIAAYGTAGLLVFKVCVSAAIGGVLASLEKIRLLCVLNVVMLCICLFGFLSITFFTT